MTQKDIYSSTNNSFIPFVVVTKVKTDMYTKRVWFTWRGAEQWLQMEIQGDGHWLVVGAVYTSEFDEYLDENLENYDSLESMFENV